MSILATTDTVVHERTRPRLRVLPAPAPASLSRFDDLVAEHDAWLRSLVRRRMADPALVDDVVQEAWMRVCRASPPAAPQDVRPWLASIAKRTCVDVWRTQPRRTAAMGPMAEAVAAPPATVPGSDEHLAAVDHRAAINDALVRLPPRHRRLLEKQALLGLSYEEIAHEERVSVACVTSALGRARAGFRRRVAAGEAWHAPVVASLYRLAHRLRARVARTQDGLAVRMAELTAATFTLGVVAVFVTAPASSSSAVERPSQRHSATPAPDAAGHDGDPARPTRSAPAGSEPVSPPTGLSSPSGALRPAPRPVGSVAVDPPDVELTPEAWRVELAVEVGAPHDTVHLRGETTLHCEGSQVVAAVCPAAAQVPGAQSSR